MKILKTRLNLMKKCREDPKMNLGTSLTHAIATLTEKGCTMHMTG
jgi:hypothetical protein